MFPEPLSSSPLENSGKSLEILIKFAQVEIEYLSIQLPNGAQDKENWWTKPENHGAKMKLTITSRWTTDLNFLELRHVILS